MYCAIRSSDSPAAVSRSLTVGVGGAGSSVTTSWRASGHRQLQPSWYCPSRHGEPVGRVCRRGLIPAATEHRHLLDPAAPPEPIGSNLGRRARGPQRRRAGRDPTLRSWSNGAGRGAARAARAGSHPVRGRRRLVHVDRAGPFCARAPGRGRCTVTAVLVVSAAAADGDNAITGASKCTRPRHREHQPFSGLRRRACRRSRPVRCR
jgi:hypothetical protein